MALACGINFGVAAFVAKLLTPDFSGGLPQIVTHWPLYALAIVGLQSTTTTTTTTTTADNRTASGNSIHE